MDSLPIRRRVSPLRKFVDRAHAKTSVSSIEDLSRSELEKFRELLEMNFIHRSKRKVRFTPWAHLELMMQNGCPIPWQEMSRFHKKRMTRFVLDAARETGLGAHYSGGEGLNEPYSVSNSRWVVKYLNTIAKTIQRRMDDLTKKAREHMNTRLYSTIVRKQEYMANFLTALSIITHSIGDGHVRW